MEALKPCPFCGGDAEIWRAHPENPRRHAWIACVSGCAVLTKEHLTDAEAIAVWNRRVPDPRLEGAEKALEPFAEAGRIWAGEQSEVILKLFNGRLLTVEDLRRAHAAHKRLIGGTDEG